MPLRQLSPLRVCLIALVLVGAEGRTETYVIQSDQSRLKFSVSHSEYVKPVRGGFTGISGEIDYDPTQAHHWLLAVDVSIDAGSVDTANRYRDAHLRSAFFEIDTFPRIRFTAQAHHMEEAMPVAGDLTMKGVTRPVELAVTGLRMFTRRDGMQVIRCRVRGTVNRREFGMEEDSDRSSGLKQILAHIQEGLDQLIGDEVEFSATVVAYRVDAPLAAQPEDAPYEGLGTGPAERHVTPAN